MGGHIEGTADSLYPLSPSPAPPSLHQHTKLPSRQSCMLMDCPDLSFLQTSNQLKAVLSADELSRNEFEVKPSEKMIKFQLRVGSWYGSEKNHSGSFEAVLWIPDILVRIRIRGSVPLTYGSGSSSFRERLSLNQQKNLFFFKAFLLFTFRSTFTSVFKAKNHKEVTKWYHKKSRFFISVQIMTDPRGTKSHGS
jgi:hypothetical protein